MGTARDSQLKNGASFATYVAKQIASKPSVPASPPFCKCPRRTFLAIASSALLVPFQDESAQAAVSKKEPQWTEDQLCYHCGGRGEQVCAFCEGSGLFVADESNMVEQALECPNCGGDGTVKCPACIGLGLADINGILRDGARDGRLRMKRDGTYDILDCSAFPSCAIYGRGAPKRRKGIRDSNAQA